ncbi:aconitase X [Pseudomonas sp. N040]|uniref:aconitase X n=1 Tax=Pseudomonas sp. N040 TaxID=2785325 RepID=UPI0018A2AFE6|nr:aconitase X catalytic domain-containing protein [Pseudomonas sp. N040]MBF7731176.1 aconitase X catalytic domain-containing protein [Pseudomonas sp. N040]MBW7014819.1 aconitase X catalytic domain-containing protein [Pseudomonas sp. N040]
MKLNTYEQEMLDGKHGAGKRFAMEKLVDFGRAVGAEEMVPLTFVHYIGCVKDLDRSLPEYKQFEWGQGLQLEPLFEMGAKVSEDPNIICTTDPFLHQLDRFGEEGTPWCNKFYKLPEVVHEASVRGYEAMKDAGWVPAHSCTPQFNTVSPKCGEYAASCESSCATYLNTIMGVHTNRENAVTGMYAAYTGVLPKYGMLLAENRRPSVIFDLDDEIKQNIVADSADWAALGGAIAMRVNNRLPAVTNMPDRLSSSAAKAFTACASPGMNDPMLHLIGITPGSPTLEAAFGGEVPEGTERIRITLKEVEQVYRDMRTATTDKVDIVHMGCPHLTYDEIRQIARAIKGKKVDKDVMLWVQTDTPSYHMAKHYGEAQIIEEAGGKIYHQTCAGMNMLSVDWGSNFTLATNSFKQVKIFGGLGHGVIFASLPELINAAVTGQYTSMRW